MMADLMAFGFKRLIIKTTTTNHHCGWQQKAIIIIIMVTNFHHHHHLDGINHTHTHNDDAKNNDIEREMERANKQQLFFEKKCIY